MLPIEVGVTVIEPEGAVTKPTPWSMLTVVASVTQLRVILPPNTIVVELAVKEAILGGVVGVASSGETVMVMLLVLEPVLLVAVNV